MKTGESRILKVILEKKLRHDVHAAVDAFDAIAKFKYYITYSIFDRFNPKKASYIALLESSYDELCGFEEK